MYYFIDCVLYLWIQLGRVANKLVLLLLLLLLLLILTPNYIVKSAYGEEIRPCPTCQSADYHFYMSHYKNA